jgi:hypothetical protein
MSIGRAFTPTDHDAAIRKTDPQGDCSPRSIRYWPCRPAGRLPDPTMDP